MIQFFWPETGSGGKLGNILHRVASGYDNFLSAYYSLRTAYRVDTII